MAFPTTQEAINALLQIWFVKIDVWAALYGLSGDTIKQIKTDAVVFNHLMLITEQFNTDEVELFTFKDKMQKGNPLGTPGAFPVITIAPFPATEVEPKPGIIPRNKLLYNHLKNHPNRTPESLADLGIIKSPGQSISPENLKVTGSAKALPDDKVELSFKKMKQQAVRWQMRRGNEDWGNQQDASTSPLIDETASVDGKPEKREYRGIYLKNNKSIGQYSDIITVYTTP